MTTENMEVRAVAAVMILAVRKSRGGEVRSVSAVENSEAITFNWSGFDYYFFNYYCYYYYYCFLGGSGF